MPHGSSSGSGHRPGATTRAGESAHTPRCSTAGRDHSGDRCVPAARSAGNCTADSSPRLPPYTAHATLDSAANCGHKGRANACFMPREHAEGPGFLDRNAPGPSLIRRPDSRIAAGGDLELGGTALRLDQARKLAACDCHKQRGEQFWGRCASILRIRRIYVTANNYTRSPVDYDEPILNLPAISSS
jgi:hypothetical protein